MQTVLLLVSFVTGNFTVSAHIPAQQETAIYTQKTPDFTKPEE
jgi:hypothetical protein